MSGSPLTPFKGRIPHDWAQSAQVMINLTKQVSKVNINMSMILSNSYENSPEKNVTGLQKGPSCGRRTTASAVSSLQGVSIYEGHLELLHTLFIITYTSHMHMYHMHMYQLFSIQRDDT